MTSSRSSRKSTHASWLSCFGKGVGNKSNCLVDDFLSYWLSFYMLPSVREDRFNQYMFPHVNKIAKGVKFTFAPLYLEPSYARLDLFAHNISRAVEIRSGDAHRLQFLQLFMWERFLVLSLKPLEFPIIFIGEVIQADGSKKTTSTGTINLWLAGG